MQQFFTGDKVTWDSQSQGSWITKTGTVLQQIERGQDAIKILQELEGKGIAANAIKFQAITLGFPRVLVKVPRGGKSTKFDYYAPRLSALKKTDQPA